MPAISVIVPVHNVEEYVLTCLDSILGLDATDIEVIVIDDASTDGSAAAIAAAVKGDDRVRLIRLAHNVGLGFARNEGLKVATGEYVLFVDSDDWLASGALAAISASLAESSPDVLIYDFARVHPDGTVARNDKAHLLGAAPAGTFRLDDYPQIVNLLQVVWNKAYRRDFIESLGLRFFGGYYEDVPWTGPVLMCADSIAVLDRVCYHYRIGRPGSIIQSNSDRHFDAIRQYERLFAFIDRHPDTRRFVPVMHARMTQHLLTILRIGRVPPTLRREFFSQVSRLYQARRPADPQVPATRDIPLRRGSYPLFKLVEAARTVRARARALGPPAR